MMDIRKKGDEEWTEFSKEEAEQIRRALEKPQLTLRESIEAQLKQHESWQWQEAEEDAAWREGMQVRLAEMRDALKGIYLAHGGEYHAAWKLVEQARREE